MRGDKCVLRRDPKIALSRKVSEGFVLLETIGDDDHWWRYLLECRCCGQRYLYDFYETVDWVGGNDPQRVMIVPISDDIELGGATQRVER